jgi:hypothetical protein
MSLWTHFVGNIRVDGVPNYCGVSIEDIKSILGPISMFDDWEDSILPTGSEGSLEYRIIEYYTGIPWVTIPIWGDLRDFGSDDDIESVKQWWSDTLKKLAWVRDAVLLIEVEDGKTLTLTHRDVEGFEEGMV